MFHGCFRWMWNNGGTGKKNHLVSVAAETGIPGNEANGLCRTWWGVQLNDWSQADDGLDGRCGRCAMRWQDYVVDGKHKGRLWAAGMAREEWDPSGTVIPLFKVTDSS